MPLATCRFTLTPAPHSRGSTTWPSQRGMRSARLPWRCSGRHPQPWFTAVLPERSVALCPSHGRVRQSLRKAAGIRLQAIALLTCACPLRKASCRPEHWGTIPAMSGEAFKLLIVLNASACLLRADVQGQRLRSKHQITISDRALRSVASASDATVRFRNSDGLDPR